MRSRGQHGSRELRFLGDERAQPLRGEYSVRDAPRGRGAPRHLEEVRSISLPLPSGAIEFTGASFLHTFALPNFYFHSTLTYALLREAGVELGKMDYLGAPKS